MHATLYTTVSGPDRVSTDLDPWRRSLSLQFSARHKKDVATRFWEKVKIGAPDECWEWQAFRMKNGYGRFGTGTAKTGFAVRFAHRVAYELTYSPVPDGLHVLHRCDNRACVNPSHLMVGTVLDNMQDMRAKGRAPIGVRHGSSKLTTEQIQNIRKRYVPYKVTASALAREYGVTEATILRVAKQQAYADVPA